MEKNKNEIIVYTINLDDRIEEIFGGRSPELAGQKRALEDWGIIRNLNPALRNSLLTEYFKEARIDLFKRTTEEREAARLLNARKSELKDVLKMSKYAQMATGNWKVAEIQAYLAQLMEYASKL